MGTAIVHDLLEEELDDGLENVLVPPFEKLRDSLLEGSYLFINDVVTFDDSELDRLMAWVNRGNTAFISANYHGYPILDTLGLEMDTEVLASSVTTRPLLNLVNKRLKSDTPFLIDRDFPVRYFNKIDTLSNTVLGVVQAYEDTLAITDPLVNFIKASWGKGVIYLHTQPEVFTNYFLLNEGNHEHTRNVLAYINDNKNVLWDAYYKSGRPVNISPLQYVFGSRYLKWAYYFVIIGVVLYVFFEGKRKQRSIPVVTPLANRTYEYTRTIAGMYFDRKENEAIARKQIAIFFEYIRTRLRVPTDRIDNEFYRIVAARSGNSIEDTQNLITFIETLNAKPRVTKEELLELSRKITNFKKNVDGTS